MTRGTALSIVATTASYPASVRESPGTMKRSPGAKSAVMSTTVRTEGRPSMGYLYETMLDEVMAEIAAENDVAS